MTQDAYTAIEPATLVLKFGDREVTVRPLMVEQFPAFSRAIEPVIGSVMAAFDKPVVTEAQIRRLLMHGEEVVEAVAIGARVDREWFNRQSLDVLVELAAAVITVNADFFAQAIAPALEAARDRVKGVIAARSGSTSSTDSSAPATAEETS